MNQVPENYILVSDRIKTITWSVAVLKNIQSMQFDCSNRTSAG
jgi:hypothetical protein